LYPEHESKNPSEALDNFFKTSSPQLQQNLPQNNARNIRDLFIAFFFINAVPNR
jgi:hypothetical protein